jgi:tripartite-type tricarboxylate transporter receptor subunit TctC
VDAPLRHRYDGVSAIYRSVPMLKAPVLALIGGMAAAAAGAAAAQTADVATYPNKPVKVIVTVPAGGGVDTVVRIITEKLQQRLGQPFVVDNRGGAAGNIGAEAAFLSEPDGYTLMASQPAPITINAVMYKKLNFDPAAFEPIVITSKIPNVLLVRNGFPARTAQEFLAYARANPEKLNYASQGIGTTSHLTAELFERMTNTKLVHIPYKGTGPALNDIVAGHVDLIFMELASAKKLHDGGVARILAVATEKRVASLPDIPTMAEAGVPGFVSDTWNALSAPPKTPRPIIDKLNAGVNEALKEPDVREHFATLNLLPGGGTPEEMGRFVQEETKRWTEVVRAAGIKEQ